MDSTFALSRHSACFTGCGVAMNAQVFKRVPWTCRWGRFGVVVDDVAAAGPRVDDVFWGCHHPVRAPDVRLMHRDECEDCPMWELAPRFTEEC